MMVKDGQAMSKVVKGDQVSSNVVKGSQGLSSVVKGVQRLSSVTKIPEEFNGCQCDELSKPYKVCFPLPLP